MILQRDKQITMWGYCKKDAKVQVKINCVNVYAAVEGTSWSAVLPPMKAVESTSMVIVSEDEKINIENVGIGDVWLAGGQSNMEFYMRYDADYKTEVKLCENSNIRFYDVPEICYVGQNEDFDYSRMGYWRECNRENLEYYSAAAYYFAKNLQADLSVPIGIIGCNRGDSVSIAWMPEKTALIHGKIWIDEFRQKCGDQSVETWIDLCQKNPMMDCGNPFADVISDELLYGISYEKQEKIMAEIPAEMENHAGPDMKNRPGSLYECMLETIKNIKIKGVIWYQGESDVIHAETYKGLLSDLIDCWRESFGEDIPFIMAQLAPFGQWMGCLGTDFPIIREAQRTVSLEKEQVYMISTSDVGLRYDIHPKKKKPVGERFALCAREHIYGEKVLSDAPVGVRAERVDDIIIIHFDNTGTGLHFREESENMLYVNNVLYDQENFTIENNRLLVSLKNMENKSKKIRIEFAQSDYYKVNVYNSADIPAIPFVCNVE
jgi:sialate O-acetylesterase